MDDRYNDEHYRDEIAYKAIRKIESVDHMDAKRMRKAVHAAKALFELNGFEIIGRIAVRNRRTGKVYG